jgi:hypothetical protein
MALNYKVSGKKLGRDWFAKGPPQDAKLLYTPAYRVYTFGTKAAGRMSLRQCNKVFTSARTQLTRNGCKIMDQGAF